MKIPGILLVLVLVLLAGQAFNANAQTETNLYSFVGSPTDGYYPRAVLMQGSDGNFYGTASYGGTYNSGTVFRISPSGSYTNLYSFGGSANNGEGPLAGLTQGNDGSFYGTTFNGGAHNSGTVFRISPGGSYSNLYSFGSSPGDGFKPGAGLMQGSDGNFYGTTEYGGTSTLNGTVFRISPSGSYTNLHRFIGPPSDGLVPEAVLVQGGDGNFYGTTFEGGTSNNGTVFRISPSGSETNLYSLGSSPNDGKFPGAGVVLGSDGNFYGTTEGGGTHKDGTVFRVGPSGNYTNLYSFGSSPTDGILPNAGLVQGSDGNFYGTTFYGGTSSNCSSGCGTVFRISPSGTYTSLYSFGRSAGDGATPYAGLVQGSDGNFYGTANFGGTSTNCSMGCGTVFKLTVPLSSPGNQISGIQLVAQIMYNVIDLGTLGGDTSQANAINNSGQIVGYTDAAGNVPHAVVWTNTSNSPIDLGTFGGSDSDASAINNSGQIAGVAQTTSNVALHAAFWPNSGSSPIDLGTLGGDTSQANAINASGQIAGQSYTAGDTNQHAAYWASSSSSPIDLGTLGGVYSYAIGINNSGQIVGQSYTTGDAAQLAAYWANSSSSPIALGTLGGEYGIAEDINNSGQIVGYTHTAGNVSHAVLWTNSSSSPVDLGTLGGDFSYAYGINNSAEIVGQSYTADDAAEHAVLWTNSSSPAIDLNSLIASNSGWIVQLANAINDSGEIVGSGVNSNGQTHACALVPVAGPNLLIFTIPSVPGEAYQLQFSSSMTPTNWVNVPGMFVTNSLGSILTLTNFAGANQPQGFYRFAITP